MLTCLSQPMGGCIRVVVCVNCAGSWTTNNSQGGFWAWSRCYNPASAQNTTDWDQSWTRQPVTWGTYTHAYNTARAFTKHRKYKESLSLGMLVNRTFFRCCLNSGKDRSGHCSLGRRSFHSWGLATEKLASLHHHYHLHHHHHYFINKPYRKLRKSTIQSVERLNKS